MTKIIPAAFIMLLAATSCGNKNNAGITTETIDSTAVSNFNALQGEWTIKEIVVNDTLVIRPSEIDSLMRRQYITFRSDSTFGITTNCNSLGGIYTTTADSISFDNIFRTEMACENMEVEEYLSKMLPVAATMTFDTDTTLIINTQPQGHILLTR